jgi:hypothetical protein
MSPFGRRGDIITALERDQYEVLWSRVQQYWTRRNLLKFWNFLNILTFFYIYIVWVLQSERVTVIAFTDFAPECNMIFYFKEIAFC